MYLIYVSKKKSCDHSNLWHWKDDKNNHYYIKYFYILDSIRKQGKKEFCFSRLQLFCDKRVLDTYEEVCVTIRDFQSK